MWSTRCGGWVNARVLLVGAATSSDLHSLSNLHGSVGRPSLVCAGRVPAMTGVHQQGVGLVVGLCYAAADCARSHSRPAIASSAGTPLPTS